MNLDYFDYFRLTKPFSIQILVQTLSDEKLNFLIHLHTAEKHECRIHFPRSTLLVTVPEVDENFFISNPLFRIDIMRFICSRVSVSVVPLLPIHAGVHPGAFYVFSGIILLKPLVANSISSGSKFRIISYNCSLILSMFSAILRNYILISFFILKC